MTLLQVLTRKHFFSAILLQYATKKKKYYPLFLSMLSAVEIVHLEGCPF